MKTLLTTLLMTLSFNSFAGDNLIQQQLKLQQNLIRIQQQNQQAMLPNRQEERREHYRKPYNNQGYYGNQGYHDNSWSAWWNNLWN